MSNLTAKKLELLFGKYLGHDETVAPKVSDLRLHRRVTMCVNVTGRQTTVFSTGTLCGQKSLYRLKQKASV
jgi:hypothetical protein